MTTDLKKNRLFSSESCCIICLCKQRDKNDGKAIRYDTFTFPCEILPHVCECDLPLEFS
jgi:hypothetical protein